MINFIKLTRWKLAVTDLSWEHSSYVKSSSFSLASTLLACLWQMSSFMKWTPPGRRLITGSQSGEFTLWNGQSFNFEMILQVFIQIFRNFFPFIVCAKISSSSFMSRPMIKPSGQWFGAITRIGWLPVMMVVQ